jgi:hypothetical protein
MISHKIKQVSVPDKIKCDICKQEDNISGSKDFVNINYTAGYESCFGDGNKVELQICDECLKKYLGEYIRVTSSN